MDDIQKSENEEVKKDEVQEGAQVQAETSTEEKVMPHEESDTKLAVANRISIWLENQAGFDHYTEKHPHNTMYFKHFTSSDAADEAFADIEEGLDYLADKIRGGKPEKEYGFTFTKKVEGGMAGAEYTYPEAALQNEMDIVAIEKNLVAIAEKWAAEHNAVVNAPAYDVGEYKYLVITIDLK